VSKQLTRVAREHLHVGKELLHSAPSGRAARRR